MESFERAQVAIVFLVVCVLVSSAHLAIVAWCARTFRLGVVKYSQGMGPIVFRSRSFTLRAVPITSYFEPASRHGVLPIDPGSDLGKALVREDLRYFEDIPFSIFVSLALCSMAISLLGGAIWLGPGGVTQAMAEGLRAYVFGGLSPLSVAQQSLDDASRFWSDHDARTSVGRAFAVLAGIELLAAPINVLGLFAYMANRPWLRAWNLLLWTAVRAVAIAWMIAFGVWMAR